jgi:hypothetical protein
MTALTGTEKSRISRERAALNLRRLDVWVPAATLDDCREAVQAVVDDYSRPEQPLPSWAVPVVSGTLATSSAAKAQQRAIDQITKGDTND